MQRQLSVVDMVYNIHLSTLCYNMMQKAAIDQINLQFRVFLTLFTLADVIVFNILEYVEHWISKNCKCWIQILMLIEAFNVMYVV